MTALSPKQRDVLASLAVFGGRTRAWARPMDIGARDGSSHTGVLRALIKKGLVERELRWGQLTRGSYKYRLTPRGWKAACS